MTKGWSSLQGEIQQLYDVENKTLVEVMRLIKGRHGFQACERSYRNQLRKWGYGKYNTDSRPMPPGRRRKGRTTASSRGREASSLLGVDPAPLQVRQQGADEEPTAIARLREAILNDDRLTMQSLLHGGVPVNIVDGCGNVPLYYAIEKGHPQMVHDMIRFGADVNVTGPKQRSLLHSAAQVGATHSIMRVREIVDALVAAGADVSPQDADGNTPLHLAFPISVEIVVQGTTNSRRTYLQTQANFIDALLEHKPDLNVKNSQGISPFELLLEETGPSTSYGYIAKFLDAGVDISEPTSTGNSIFSDFLARSMKESGPSDEACGIIRHFLLRGADLTTALPSGEPFIRHVLKGHSRFDPIRSSDIVELMGGVSTIWDDGNSIAHDLCIYCTTRGYFQTSQDIQRLAETIVGANNNPDVRNNRGQTPLLLLSKLEDIAFFDRVLPILTALLKSGADPFAQDRFGKSPLLEIAKSAPAKYIEIFLEADLHRMERGSNGGFRNTTESHGVEPLEQRFYWEDWEHSARATEWSTARRIVINPRCLLTEDVDGKLRKGVLVVLAKKHVGLVASAVAEEGDSSSRRETLRKEFSCILRDYKTTGRVIPAAWVDMLLELS